MKITKLLQQPQTVTLSCELFPPKVGAHLDNVKGIVEQTAALHPSYISITYGASGGTSDYTVDIADHIQNHCAVPALAHLTCASSDHGKVQSVLDDLENRGIQNILALRGDIPANAEFPLPNQYHHASELITEIRNRADAHKWDVCIGGACYPEGHPEAPGINADLDNLKKKIDAGCDFLTTQMFFDNNIYYNFRYKMLARGIAVPVIPGIMPVTNAVQLKRIMALSGNMIPPRFKAIVERFADNQAAMQQAGVAYATEQIIDLIANGVRNVHIYTMNKPSVAGKIFENLSDIIKK